MVDLRLICVGKRVNLDICLIKLVHIQWNKLQTKTTGVFVSARYRSVACLLGSYKVDRLRICLSLL